MKSETFCLDGYPKHRKSFSLVMKQNKNCLSDIKSDDQHFVQGDCTFSPCT